MIADKTDIVVVEGIRPKPEFADSTSFTYNSYSICSNAEASDGCNVYCVCSKRHNKAAVGEADKFIEKDKHVWYVESTMDCYKRRLYRIKQGNDEPRGFNTLVDKYRPDAEEERNESIANALFTPDFLSGDKPFYDMVRLVCFRFIRRFR